MKLLETVLNFLLTLAQVIFPRKRKPSPTTVLVLLPCLVLLSLWKGETEVTLASIGGILSLLKGNRPTG